MGPDSPPAGPESLADLGDLAPEGQCNERAVLLVALDGTAVEGISWQFTQGASLGGVGSGAVSSTPEERAARFVVGFQYRSGLLGAVSAQDIGATLALFVDDIVVDCNSSEVTGEVRFSVAQPTEAPNVEFSCGAYDITCSDSQSGHQARLRVVFNETVGFSPPGAGGGEVAR